MAHPQLGVGVIIENSENKVLVGKRRGSHAPYFSIPGGKLEVEESFEEAAIREVLEETGLNIVQPKVIGITNNLKTLKSDNIHFVSVILHCKKPLADPIVCEPEKCVSWEWVEPFNLPQPHFEASTLSIKCFLENQFYTQENYQV